IYADGGEAHPALEPKNFTALQRAMQRRAGLVLLHYATEPTIENGETEFLAWIGGAFEINWSVNPHWAADFKMLPDHPVTRGVAPFSLLDEWYFHLRFAPGVTPLLAAVPPPSTMQRRDGPHSGNPHVRAAVARGEPQTVAWTFERPDGGRGFGLTGGHFHRNWGQRDFRTLVLNAILWTAQMDVPADGVASVVTAEDLARNLDPKP
ncbi:MAG TPA: ThuA domain-containing protein, partial [Opitutus sp.]|nr:ThuA domain-containing protein [Opitutus sp.]